MTNKYIKSLNKAYKKHFKKIYKNFSCAENNYFTVFIDSLRCKRDLLLLQAADEATLTAYTAIIAEFDAAICAEDATKKRFHWNNFCEQLKQNMEEWQI